MAMLQRDCRLEGYDIKGSAATLARAFSPSVLAQLAKFGKSNLLETVIKESGFEPKSSQNSSLRVYFDLIYDHINHSYRNEYIYKNTIANKVLLGRHSLNTATMLTEFRVSGSKADVLILNGTSHIYEIKTELDSLDRLPKQLEDYMQFAEYVSVVSSESHLKKLLETINCSIGVLVLTKRGTLRTIRKAKSGIEKISQQVIFDSLRQSEYRKILKLVLGTEPDVPNALMHSECKKFFPELPILICHEQTVKTLKLRKADELTKRFIQAVPNSLKAAAISSNLNKSQIRKLIEVLN